MIESALTALGLSGDLWLGQFARLVDQLPVVLWSTDQQLRITAIRGGGARAGEEGKTIEEAFENPKHAAPAVAAHRAALRGESVAYEIVLHGRAFSARVEPLVGPQGDVVGVVGFASDVTDRDDSQERLRTIIDSDPDCVKQLDAAGRLLDMNPAGLAMIQAESIEQVRGLEIAQVIAPEYRAAFNDLNRRVFAGSSGTLEFEIIGLKGQRRWLATHAVPLRDASGTIQAALGITRDISRRRIAELALVESEERFCKAFYANALPLVITRLSDGMVLDANEAFTKLLNRPREEILGQTTVSLGVMEPAGRASVIERLRAEGVVNDVELELHPRDSAPRTGLLSVVRIELGGQECILGTYRDVTEAKRAEEQLRASRTALRSLATRQQDIREDERSRIAREIHDSLGQALTALKLQLVAAQDVAATETPALSARLAETALMVDDLVKSVRRIATELRPPILDQLGLPAAVEWLAQDFARRTGIRCQTSIHPTDGAITNELATALFRIVQEALTNALRHAGATRVDIELGVKSGCVMVEINDDGTGITEVGMGPGSLGILGMRERAAALGGVLEVAPRSNGGTRVAAWFPPR